MIDLTLPACALQVINGLIEALVSVRRLQKYVSLICLCCSCMQHWHRRFLDAEAISAMQPFVLGATAGEGSAECRLLDVAPHLEQIWLGGHHCNVMMNDLMAMTQVSFNQ